MFELSPLAKVKIFNNRMMFISKAILTHFKPFLSFEAILLQMTDKVFQLHPHVNFFCKYSTLTFNVLTFNISYECFHYIAFIQKLKS